MSETPKLPDNEEDKYKKVPGRQAAEQEEDTAFLDGEALEADLVDPSEVKESEGTNQEWPAREESNQVAQP